MMLLPHNMILITGLNKEHHDWTHEIKAMLLNAVNYQIQGYKSEQIPWKNR